MSESGLVAAAVGGQSSPATDSNAGTAPPELTVIFICTGNRFRSPLAAAIFSEAVQRLGIPASVRSVGTIDTGPAPAFRETLEQARRFGLNLEDHRARSGRDEDLQIADIVIGFERSHIAFAVVDAGVAAHKSFTLPELVMLLEFEDVPVRGDGPVVGARLAVAQADARRVALGRVPGSPEIADPVSGPRRAYARTADEIKDLVTRLVHELFG